MNTIIKEGALYREITLHGETFQIYYGYYEEKDRTGKYNDPIPIYPNFKQQPKYTKEGYAFVTQMQDACKRYKGKDKEDGCHSCLYFKKGEDLLGICFCKENKKIK